MRMSTTCRAKTYEGRQVLFVVCVTGERRTCSTKGIRSEYLAALVAQWRMRTRPGQRWVAGDGQCGVAGDRTI